MNVHCYLSLPVVTVRRVPGKGSQYRTIEQALSFRNWSCSLQLNHVEVREPIQQLALLNSLRGPMSGVR
jgi:hypothetical protein